MLQHYLIKCQSNQRTADREIIKYVTLQSTYVTDTRLRENKQYNAVALECQKCQKYHRAHKAQQQNIEFLASIMQITFCMYINTYKAADYSSNLKLRLHYHTIAG